MDSPCICLLADRELRVLSSINFRGHVDFCNPSILLSWMFEHDCLNTCCFVCLICMCFIFLYLHLLGAVEHVSNGKVLKKYNHYY